MFSNLYHWSFHFVSCIVVHNKAGLLSLVNWTLGILFSMFSAVYLQTEFTIIWW